MLGQQRLDPRRSVRHDFLLAYFPSAFRQTQTDARPAHARQIGRREGS
jgi:hypothetical protein